MESSSAERGGLILRVMEEAEREMFGALVRVLMGRDAVKIERHAIGWVGTVAVF